MRDMRDKSDMYQAVSSRLSKLSGLVDGYITRAGVDEDYARLLSRCIRETVGALDAQRDESDIKLPVSFARLYNKVSAGGYGGCCGSSARAAVHECDTADRQRFGIVMCGYTAAAATLVKYYENKDALYKRYSEDYLRPVETLADMLFLDGISDIVKKYEPVYSVEISAGGVYEALWNLGEALVTGLEVSHESIPILQETVEICEFTGDNPYMSDGCGAALFVTRDAEELAESFRTAGYEAEAIGHLTEARGRVVTHDGECRYLEPPRVMQKSILS